MCRACTALKTPSQSAPVQEYIHASEHKAAEPRTVTSNVTNSYTPSCPVFHPFIPITGQDYRSSLRVSEELQGEASPRKNILELPRF